ncbi:hypothetical protein H9660_15635 [Clostridium sp. Sa3CUN1]|uniref:HTH merR-type domain-containing protein n=1 Tax=Clostridium gallinarum TaxID=2762246 RepID=A0ABR8Q800_9CLOT|nr:hypothetical protein [Clostridium gallinarum]MBD7916564.1 hypothetical protein [Clostridium gallinarum]
MSENKIKKRRGRILYYSLDQVATLLDIDESKVKYYINLFSQYVKLEIINKQARLHEKEILKLEFLIDLHSKGISNKQAEEYFNNMAFDDFDSKFDTIIDPPSYEELLNSIKNIEHIVSLQNKNNINESYINILNEISGIKESLNLTKDINNLIEKLGKTNNETIKTITELADNKNNELIDKITNLIKTADENRSNKDIAFINEVKKNISILTSAYNIQSEMIAEQKENNFKLNLINKITNFFKSKNTNKVL